MPSYIDATRIDFMSEQGQLFPPEPQSPRAEKREFFPPIEIEVLTPAQYSISRAGNPVAIFAARRKSDGLTLKIIATKGAANYARTSLVVGDKITAAGKLADDEDNTFFAWGLHKPGEKAQLTARQRMVQDYGSVEAAKEAEERWVKSNLALSLVPLREKDQPTRWERKEYCIERNGRWQSKMEVLGEKLGWSTVNRALREIIRSSDIERSMTFRETKSGLSKTSFPWVKNLRAWVDSEIQKIEAQEAEALFP